ncbi:hypothetical protein DOY81_014184, partial [Sarcophaga bullata]
MVSGWHIMHCILSTAIGAVAVVFVHPSNCHLVAFAVMFGYLMFFRLVDWFGFVEPPGH